MHVRQWLTARPSMHMSCTTHARDVCVQRAGGRKVNAYGPPHPSSAPRIARVEPARESVPSGAPSTLTSTSLSRPASRAASGPSTARRRRRRRRSPRSRREPATAPSPKAKPSADVLGLRAARGRSRRGTARRSRQKAASEAMLPTPPAERHRARPRHPAQRPAGVLRSGKGGRRRLGRRRLRRCRRLRLGLGRRVDRRRLRALLAKLQVRVQSSTSAPAQKGAA